MPNTVNTMRPASPRGRDVGIQHRQERLPLIALVHDVQHVAGVAPKPVEPGHDELVAGPQELDDGG